MTWGDSESAEQVRKWWMDDGKTAGWIAAQFHQVSRAAIIGLVHRRHWAKPPKPALIPIARVRPSHSAKPKARPVSLVYKTPQAIPVPVELVEPVITTKITLVDLGVFDCKWPVGEEPATEDCVLTHFFCGAPQDATGGPYCPFHRQKASNGLPVRKSALRPFSA